MNSLLVAIVEGMTAFAATNVDDLIILLLFFAQVDSNFRPYHVVSGAYWGFGALVALSLVGFFGGMLVPPAWIGLLGIMPILLGIQQLRSPKEETQVQTVTAAHSSDRPEKVTVLARLMHPRAYQVAVVTFANGGDNIGIYVPLFAASNAIALGIILTVFFLLKGVWCYVAYRLTQNPQIAHVLTQYGHRAVPFVLIGLGLFILWKNGTLQLLTSG